MKVPLSSCVVYLGLAVAAGSAKPHAAPPHLLVVNQTDHTISILDPEAGRLIAAVDVKGMTGHEVGLSPDERQAFIPIYGDSGVGKRGSDGSTIAVVDIETHKLVRTLDFGHGVRPHCVVTDTRRNLVYVTTELDRTISILDPRSLRVVGSIPTGQDQSHMLTLSHDGRFGYTANVGPGTVSVLDMEARKLLKVIPVSANTQRIALSNDDKYVFTADQTKPQLAVIETQARQLKSWVELPSVGYGTAPTRDGRWLLVALPKVGKVAVIDLAALKVARVLDLTGTPTEILVRPDGKVAYVSCGKKVAAIDLTGDVTTWHVDLSMEAGEGADGLAWVS